MPNLIDDKNFEEAMIQIKEYIDNSIETAWKEGVGGGGNPGYGTEWNGDLVPINGGGTGANNPTDAFANLFGYTSYLSTNGGMNANLNNVALGQDALIRNIGGVRCTAVGNTSMHYNAGGTNNTAVGYQSLFSNNNGSNNVSIGNDSLYQSTAGDMNVAVGAEALYNNRSENCNTAVGYQAMKANTSYKNSGGFGYDAQVTSNNQIQLGSGNTTVYVYGSVQSRSDERDKANIQTIEYPYRDFVMGLRAVTFQWDMREDYRKDIEKLGDIVHNGTHIRSRRHNGFVAQEVKALADRLGFDFSGYQDHSVGGGDDVKSLGYEAFIAPLVATVQDQDKEIKGLRTQITDLVGYYEGRFEKMLEYIDDLKSAIQNII